MKLAIAEEELKKLRLPAWVADVSVEDNYDQDGEMYVRVWLKVADDFDLEGHYNEFDEAEELIRKHLWSKGTKEWVQVGIGPGTDDE
jgi:hypothetical protein